MSNFCSNCGTAISGAFCSSCGTKVTNVTNATTPTATDNLVFQQSRQVYNARPGAPTSGTAIAAIICAFLFPLLGFILGLVAKNEIANSRGEKSGESIAMAAILLSVFFFFIWIFIGLMWYDTVTYYG